MINLSSISGLSLSVACLLLAIFILSNAKAKAHKIWALFNVSVAVFGFGSFLVSTAGNSNEALLSWKVFWFGLIFISVFFYHLVIVFSGSSDKKFLIFVYFQAAVFSFLVLFTDQMSSVFIRPFEFYYVKWNIVNTLFFVVWLGIALKSFCKLFHYKQKNKGIKGVQASYLFYGMILGFISGLTTALPCYGINIYPVWHFFICVYAAISTYAIFRYHLMDIKVVVSRFGIFVFVYLIVLGVPLLFGYRFDMWRTATWSMLFFATLGPFIYLYLQRTAEARILQEEIRVRNLLRSVSHGMTKVRKMDKLLKVVVDVLTKSLRLDNVGIYLNDGEEYVIKKVRVESEKYIVIHREKLLIRRLLQTKVPLVYEEMKVFLDENSLDKDLCEIVKTMKDLGACVIVPIIEQEFLLGFILLGARKDGGVYSQDLINTLVVLGNQVGLAAENAIYVEESEKDLAQLFQDNKQKAIGALASGVAHQFNNRFNSMVLAADMAFEYIGNKKLSELSEKAQEKVIKYLKQIKVDSLRGGEIADAILKYSKADVQSRVVNFGDIVKASLEVYFIEHPHTKHVFNYDYSEKLLVWVNFAMLQDIIKTGVSNSVDAIKSKENRIKQGSIVEDGFEPKIIIRAKALHKSLIIELEDNGIGLTKDQLENKIFTPFFTTKGVTKGTGLGVAMMQKLTQQCGGEIKYESEYEKWTKFIIKMPLATKEQIEKNEEDVL